MSADGHFQRQAVRWAPPWFLGPSGSTLLESFGATLDLLAERVLDGRRAAIPYSSARMADGGRLRCEPDALPWHALDRGLPIYQTEPEESQRYRLSRWRQLRAHKGTHRGELEHVRPYFLTLADPMPVIRIVHQAGDGSCCTWHTLDADGVYSISRVTPSNFDRDGQPAKWARWSAFVYLHGTGIAPPYAYGDGHVYGDGARYGCRGLTAEQHADIVRMFLDWQAADSVCTDVALCWGASDVDPAGTPTQDASGWWSLPAGHWGRTVDPVTRLGTRPPTVQWIYEYP